MVDFSQNKVSRQVHGSEHGCKPDLRVAVHGRVRQYIAPSSCTLNRLARISTITTPLNSELLPHNTCFGCGLENPHGLNIEIHPSAEHPERLRAQFAPTENMTGFPGITHGGAIYTALDCLSTWVATLLGPNRSAAWLLRSATVTYQKPAPMGEPLTLEGWIKTQGTEWEPLIVATEVRRPDNAVCVEAEFKVVPLSLERLKAVTGVEEIPLNWQQFLTRGHS